MTDNELKYSRIIFLLYKRDARPVKLASFSPGKGEVSSVSLAWPWELRA
jgi:hypothetical protein